MFPPGYLDEFSYASASQKVQGQPELVVDYVPPEFVQDPLEFITFVTKLAALDYGIDLDDDS